MFSKKTTKKYISQSNYKQYIFACMSKTFSSLCLLLLAGGILFFHSCAKDRGKPPRAPFNIHVVEGFESSANLPSGWTLWNPNNDAAWQVVTTVGHSSNSCIGFNNCSGNGTNDMTGTRDRFNTATYDFSQATSASISFDVAYAALNFKGTLYADSLSVFYSTDGNTWNRIYLNGGDALANIPEITTSPPCYVPASAADWRTDKISLNNLAGQSNVIFAFENRSAWGEWVYLDNITITATNQAPCNATYAKNVQPVMMTSCALSGCHDAASGRTDLSSYTGVKSIVDNGNLKKRMIDGNPSFMPTSGKLADSTLSKVQCWLDNGGLNN